MLHLLPSIRFLQPPTACGPLRLDRFSPYYNAPAAFGFINVRPMVSYKYLYPFDDESLHRIAYYFDYDYEAGVDPTGYAALVVAYVEAWRREPERGALYSIMRPDGTLALVDTRSDAARPELVFSGLEQEAYEYCDTLHTGASVAQHLRRTFPDAHFTDQQVLAFLDSLVANKLMVTADCYYLSLAVRAQLVM